MNLKLLEYLMNLSSGNVIAAALYIAKKIGIG
jgi:hypothetical protein